MTVASLLSPTASIWLAVAIALAMGAIVGAIAGAATVRTLELRIRLLRRALVRIGDGGLAKPETWAADALERDDAIRDGEEPDRAMD